ncbi:hypothetical protein [Nitrospira sp. Kam-Ns4a]
MSIQFGEIHNVIRTYRRLLQEPLDAVRRPAKPGERDADRISISREARELHQAPNTPGAPSPGSQR